MMPLLLLLALAGPAPGSPGNTPRPTGPAPLKIVILDVKAAAAADGAEAALVTQALAAAFQELHKGPVVTVADAKALIDAQAQNELLGCADPRCAKELGDVLAADLLLASVYGSLGGQKHLAVTLLDAKEARVVDRWSISFDARRGTAMTAATRTLATRALNPGAHDNGDQALSGLRTALLIDELDAAGAPQANNTVQTCVQAVLLEADVRVVRAAQVQLVKTGSTKGADVAAALDPNVVDVVVYGTARTTLVGKLGTRTAVRTGFTFEIVKVDTGDVIASASASPMQNAATSETATELASKLACEQVKPALQAALQRRIERGNRVVVTVPLKEAIAAGRAPVAAANDVVTLLSAEKSVVARASLKNIDEKAGVAIIDVVVRGGDGVTLALALARSAETGPALAARIPQAGPGGITLLP